MFPNVVLYSNRLKERGYQQGYVGKWHASWTRSPLDFGFDRIAGVHGCDPKLLADIDLNPDKVELPREEIESRAPSHNAVARKRTFHNVGTDRRSYGSHCRIPDCGICGPYVEESFARQQALALRGSL